MAGQKAGGSGGVRSTFNVEHVQPQLQIVEYNIKMQVRTGYQNSGTRYAANPRMPSELLKYGYPAINVLLDGLFRD